MVDPTLNLRSFALTTLIVVLFTSSMIWLNRDDLSPGYARYEKYGISLSYPKLMSLREVGLPNTGLGSDPSDFAGLVQFQSYWENKLDVFEIIWFVKNRASSAEAELDGLLMEMSQPNSVVRGMGEYFVIVFGGEEVKCVNIEVEEAGNTFSGVVGVIYRPWSSPGVARIYFVAYATFRGSATEEQLHAGLQTYMEGLSI